MPYGDCQGYWAAEAQGNPDDIIISSEECQKLPRWRERAGRERPRPKWNVCAGNQDLSAEEAELSADGLFAGPYKVNPCCRDMGLRSPLVGNYYR